MMKKIISLFALCLLAVQLFAQAPQRLSYQAIIRNGSNVLITNAPIKMRISILQRSITGAAVYSELHSTITNASGVAFIEVGGGAAILGNFSTINWAQGPYFLRSETDPNNGTNYSIVGTIQLLSVPYSFHANRASRADSATRADNATRADSANRARRSDTSVYAENGLPPSTIHGELKLYQCNGKIQYTPCLPIVVTAPLGSITGFSANSGGSIASDGGAAITARGVVWSTLVNPTIALATRTSNGMGAGTYSSSLTNLTPNTLYYIRAYATNSAGTVYGNELSFRTGRLPVVSTINISAITATTAIGGGNVTDSGTATITARGVVWSTSQNPTIALTTRTTNGIGIGSFTSSITGLISDSVYFVRAYATSSAGTAYGSQVSFRAGRLPVVSTNPVSAITFNSANGGGNVTDSGSARVTARGVVWSTSQNPTIALTTRTSNGTGIGIYTSSITGLTPSTLYYVRAYATNSAGTAYGAQLSFTSALSPYPVGTVHCNNTPTAIVEVTNPITGRVWMDRNLGASRAATSSADTAAYGDLYQWGRLADGHQCRNSGVTSLLSSTDQPAHRDFILGNDWRNPSNSNLWQGVNGINNPCPTGFRLPTESELSQEISTWSSNNSLGAFLSSLKLSLAGRRTNGDGQLSNLGNDGDYWSSSISGSSSRNLHIRSGGNSIVNDPRSRGVSVRCIKDAVTQAFINSLECGAATNNGILASGIAASGVSSNVPYSGGNGGTYAAQSIASTGVTGLTATLAAGTLANGAGTLTYTISGTPATSGTASFALSIGGQTCILTRTVNFGLTGITVHSCGASNVHNPSVPYGSMTDQQGNVYRTVKIGNQIWMAENLRTTVYRNNTPIQGITDITQWESNTTGAYCSYNNGTTNDCPYGKLYNWYAVNSTNQLCPAGWHIPNDAEWNLLIASLDSSYNPVADGSQSKIGGGKMKSAGTQYWLSPNTGASNSSGWSGLPGGARDSNGSFFKLGGFGYWWSSSEYNIYDILHRTLYSGFGDVSRNFNGKSLGFSVRCVKD